MSNTNIKHVHCCIYENDDHRELCLECNDPIEEDMVYCDKCYRNLVNSGFFDQEDEDDYLPEEEEETV